MSTFFPKVRLWPGKSMSLDPADWGVGVDITEYVRRPGQDGGQVISYSSGRQDEANQVDAGTMNLTLDNRTGIWSPKNVAGTYYGQLRRNTPIQLATITGYDAFTRSLATGTLGTSTSGLAWSAGVSFTVTGTDAYSLLAANTATYTYLTSADAWNFDVRQTCWVDQVATGAPLIAALAGRGTDISNMIMARVEFNTAGTVDLKLGTRIAAALVSVSEDLAVFSYTADEKVRARMVGDGQTIRAKIWKPANPALPDDDEPDAWNATMENTTLTGSQVGIFPWRVGGNTNVNPRIYFDDFAADAEEWTGYVAQWPMRWDKTGNNSWAPIQASGILRRLRQGRNELQSPLRRQLAGQNPTGFWPLEDEAGATSFAAYATGRYARFIQPGTFRDVTPAASTDLPGASRAPTFDTATSTISVRTPYQIVSQTGFNAMFLFKLGSLPGGNTMLARIRATGRVNVWDVAINDTSFTISGYEGAVSGTPLATSTAVFGAEINPLEWVAVTVETVINGANTEWVLLTHAVGDVTYYAQSGSYASTAGSVATEMLIGGTRLDGASFSMLWLGPNTLPFVDDTFSLVSNGYASELAMDRGARVADETGIRLMVEPGTSEAMGAQKESTPLEALRGAEASDYGVLYETGSGLGIRPRVARFNAEQTLTLSMVAGHLSDAPEPIYDDQKLRNVWTVSRIGGSSATVADDDSVAEDGEVPDSAQINVQTDEVLDNHAGWRTYLGVQDDLRWPVITLDFARNPDLLPYWRSRRYGFRFGVTTGLTQTTGSEPDVIAEGHQAELHPDGWRVSLNCSSAAPWDVAVLESATAPVRLDTAGCELTAAPNTTTLTWSVTTTDGPSWNPSTTFPILMKCGGEVVSVASITGAGPAQTLNLGARSVNGVVAGHAIGDAVSLAYPSRLAL